MLAGTSVRPVSIDCIICTYNHCESLIKTIASVLMSATAANVDLRLIVVDNNSTDRTKEYVQEHAKQDERVYYAFEEQQGVYFARRRGILESIADFVLFVDDDVTLSGNWINQAASFVQAHPPIGILSGRINLNWVQEPTPLAKACRAGLAHVDFGDQERRFPIQGAYPVGAAMLLSREAVLKTGWIESAYLLDRHGDSLASGGDTELSIRILRMGFEAWYCPALNATHSIPASRMSARYLCRLYYGFGRSSAILSEIACGGTSNYLCRGRQVVRCIVHLIYRATSLVVFNHLWKAHYHEYRRIQVAGAAGALRSAWDVLVHGIPSPLK